MRVIKEGPGQPVWTKELVCTGEGFLGGGCEARLLVSSEDVTYEELTSSFGSLGDIYYFTCPLCGMSTEIEECVIDQLNNEGRKS